MNDLNIGNHERGAILPIKVQPGSSRDKIGEPQDRRLKVFVTCIAEKGKANVAATALLAKHLRIRKSAIQILKGYTSQLKDVLIVGETVEGLLKRLDS